MPFNHRWFEVSVVNATTGAVSTIELWDGSQWQAMVDVIDQTSVAGVTLARSGAISWVPERTRTAWNRQDTTENISDLSTLKIYDMYWVRMTFSANWDLTTALQFIGHRFSNDTDLAAEYPELSQSALKTAYTAGKTTWNDQHLTAADQLIRDLRSNNIIVSKSQILDAERLRMPAIHLTASIIYRALGKGYEDQRVEALRSYKTAMNDRYFNIDLNQNAKLDDGERHYDVTWMHR